MICNDIYNDIDSCLLCSGTKLCQVLCGAEPGLVFARDTDADRLIELPPVSAGVGPRGVVVLRRLYRRSLYGCVARRRNVRQRRSDLVIRPVEAMQDRAALYDRLIDRLRIRDRCLRRKDRRYKAQHHQQCKQNRQQFTIHMLHSETTLPFSVTWMIIHFHT